jgi:transposase InsO family protein
VIGWALDEGMHTDLVQTALAMAMVMRGELAGHVILHADRGCQHTSGQLARFAREHNVVRSVGRTAVYWDNAQHESFWATLKVEFYDRYPSGRPRQTPSSRSVTGSSESITDADATQPSV